MQLKNNIHSFTLIQEIAHSEEISIIYMK